MPVREPVVNMESALRDPLVTDLMDVPVDLVHLEESVASVSCQCLNIYQLFFKFLCL